MYVGTVSSTGALNTYSAAPGVAYQTYSSRNGDYSTVVYDPASNSFWAANEYADSDNASVLWDTWIQQFSPSTVVSHGGGLESVGGSAILINCTVSDNSADEGGGIYVDATSSVTLMNTIVAANTSDISGAVSGSYNLIGTGGSGGLIDGVDGNIVGVADPLLAPLGDYGGPTQTMALLTGSPAINAGTGIGVPTTDQRGFGRIDGLVDIGAFESGGPLVVDTTVGGAGSEPGQLSLRQAVNLANILTGDESISFDPIVFATPQTITLTTGQLRLSNTTGTQSITGSVAGVTVSGNHASRVFQVNGGVTASIWGLTIADGNASQGGGVYNSGTTTLTECTLSGNFGVIGGGMFNAPYGDTTLTNCTLSGNTSYYGGGMINYFSAEATLTNCTVSGNTAYNGGGGLFNFYGAVTLTNAIIAGNNSDISGFAVSGTHNLIGNGGSGGLIDGVDGNIVGVANPLLTPLGNYGGPTQTMALLPGSAAIDAGTSTDAPSTDQRGESRFGAFDIGAFESQGFSFTAVPGSTPQSSDIGTAFANPLAVNVVANNPIEPVDGGVVNFVANPAGNGASAIFSASSAVISGGVAGITAAPNNVLSDPDSYTVDASAGALSATFDLTNTGTPFAALVVNTTSDLLAPGPGLLSLREAIGFANTDPLGTSDISFDVFVFALIETITLTTSQLELTHGTDTITGPAAGVIVNGDGLYRVFQVDAGVTATITGLTITGGIAGNGGGLYNLGTTTLTGCTVSGNSASSGGGLFNSGGTLTLNNTTVSGNSATSGGGIFNAYGVLTMSGCIVSGNTAGYFGGGIYDRGGIATLTDCLLSGNSAAFYGGGIINVYGTDTLTDCIVSGNSSSNPGFSHGGGVANFYGSTTLTNVDVSGNSARDGGGVWSRGGGISLTDCTISGNSATSGGGIFQLYGALTMNGSLVSGNTAAYYGGGIYDRGGSSTLTNCTISDNSANYDGGGIMIVFATDTLTNCIVSGNSTSRNGGGVANIGGTTYLTGSSVSNNSASYGGGIWNGYGGNATLTECTVSGNSADFGGGIYNSYGGNATLTDSTISSNYASSDGGGLYNNGTISLTRCTVSDNSAGRDAGGLWNGYNGNASLTDSTVSGNSSYGYFGGGGIYSNGTLALTNCTVSGNSAAVGGGGVYVNDGTATLTNCTISGNTAGASGGGVAVWNAYSVTLTNCTVSGNSADGSGGGLKNFFSSVTLINTIVAGNTNSVAAASDISGTVSGSNNLIGTGGAGGLVNGVAGNIVGVANALLAPLGNYGGPTQTMPLLPGSLAINNGIGGAGIPVADQRGMGRVGAVDIGAFESQGFTLTPVAGGTGQTAIVGNAFANALAVIVTANNVNEPVNGGIVTFVATPAGNGASATFSGSAVISGGQASVIATANLIVGSYTVSASATGAVPVVSFALRNITTVDASATAVGWGSQTRGLAGRTNLPWTNISKFVLTFNSPVAPTIGDLSVIGRGGRVYVVSSVSVVGNTVTWTLAAPITAADIVTVTVNPLLAIYSIQLRILPGDVNDDGIVNAQDQVLVRNAYLGIGTPSTIPRVFFDLNGDGVVNVTDYNLARSYNGTRL